MSSKSPLVDSAESDHKTGSLLTNPLPVVTTKPIERKVTDEYPIRYAALYHPRILFENPDTALVHPKKGNFGSTTGGNGGREFAVYRNYYEIRKKNFGVYGEIVSYQGIDYLVDLHAYKPIPQRPFEEQTGIVKRVPTYKEAIDLLLSEIPRLEKWAGCKQ